MCGHSDTYDGPDWARAQVGETLALVCIEDNELGKFPFEGHASRCSES